MQPMKMKAVSNDSTDFFPAFTKWFNDIPEESRINCTHQTLSEMIDLGKSAQHSLVPGNVYKWSDTHSSALVLVTRIGVVVMMRDRRPVEFGSTYYEHAVGVLVSPDIADICIEFVGLILGTNRDVEKMLLWYLGGTLDGEVHQNWHQRFEKIVAKCT